MATRVLGDALVNVIPKTDRFALLLHGKIKEAVAREKVEIPVTIDAKQFNYDYAALNAKVAAASRRLHAFRIGADDKEAQLVLLKLNNQLLRLEYKVANPRLQIQGKTQALADIAAVNLALDRLNKKQQDINLANDRGGGPFAFIDNLLGGKKGGGGGGRSLLQQAGQSVTPGGAGVTPAGIGVATGIGAGILSVIGPIVPALVAATAALGAFGALALPTLSDLQTGLSAVSTASDTYATASANLNTAINKSPADLAAYRAVLKGLEPDLASAAVLLTNQSVTWQSLTPAQRASEIALRNNAAAYRTLLPSQKDALNALIKEGNAWNALSPGQQAAAAATQKLQAGFQSLADALAPVTLTVLNAGLKVANDLLPILAPLAQAAATAILALLGGLDAFAKSAGFKSFIALLVRQAGPAIEALGFGMGRVVIALGKLLIAMSSPNGARILLGIFTLLAAAINGIALAFTLITPVMTKVIDFIARHWATIGPILELPFKNFFLAVKLGFDFFSGIVRTVLDLVQGQWGKAWNDMKTAAARIWSDMEKSAGNLWKALIPRTLRHELAVIFDGIRHDLIHILDLMYNDTIGDVIRLTHNAETQWNSFRHATANIFDGVRHDLARTWNNIYGDTIGAAIRIGHNVETQWDSLRHATANIFDGIRSDIAQIFTRDIPALFRAGESAVSRIWSNIKNDLSTPVRIVVNDVLDPLIHLINNVLGFIHLGSIPTIKLARGGQIPGFGGGDQVPALLERGEAVVDKMTTKKYAGVLRQMGVPGFAAGGYVDPIPPGVLPGRVDQGVDFSGSGPVRAIGDASVIETAGGGWPGGPFMSYKLLNGQYANWGVYVAENIIPKVRAGQAIRAGQVIAQMFNGGTGIETGFTDSTGTIPLSQTPAAGGISGANLPPGGTFVGRQFEALLLSLGAPAATNLGAAPGGHQVPGALSGVNLIGAIFQTLEQVFAGLGNMAKIALDLAHGDTGGAARALFGLLGKPNAGGAGGEFAQMLLGIPGTAIKDVVKFLVKPVTAFGNAGTALPAGGATSGNLIANGTELFSYLLQNLFRGNRVAAAGAIASIWGESNWNPFAQGTGGRGLIGWTPPGTISDADFRGGMATQLPAIIRFVQQSHDMGVIALMEQATTILQAANLWGQGVERFGINDVHPEGLALAKQIAGLKQGGLVGMARGGRWPGPGGHGPAVHPSTHLNPYKIPAHLTRSQWFSEFTRQQYGEERAYRALAERFSWWAPPGSRQGMIEMTRSHPAEVAAFKAIARGSGPNARNLHALTTALTGEYHGAGIFGGSPLLTRNLRWHLAAMARLAGIHVPDIPQRLHAFPPPPAGPQNIIRAGEFSFDRGGTLAPGWNLAWNGTGRREHLTPDSGAGVTLNLTVNIHGPVGSRAELETWLLSSINHLAKTSQLTYALRRSPSAH